MGKVCGLDLPIFKYLYFSLCTLSPYIYIYLHIERESKWSVWSKGIFWGATLEILVLSTVYHYEAIMFLAWWGRGGTSIENTHMLGLPGCLFFKRRSLSGCFLFHKIGPPPRVYIFFLSNIDPWQVINFSYDPIHGMLSKTNCSTQDIM